MVNTSLQILLVEDNLTDVLLMEEALEEFPAFEFVLKHVPRLDEAMVSLRDGNFDAVLLDLGLPDSQGIETFAKLQSQHPGIPILVVSGLDDESVSVHAVQQGAQDYLIKGKIDSSMLSRTIRYAIERKRAEQRLIDSEIGHRRLFESAQDGIFILNAGTGQITDANPALEQMLGYTLPEMIGKRLWEIGPFRDKTASKAAFQTLQDKGHIHHEDLPLATKDGRFIDAEFVSNVYLVQDRKVIQCNIRDIGDRKRAVAAAQEAQRALQSTVDALSSHIAVLDQNGNILAVNKAWSQFSDENDGATFTCGVGANYLEVCDRASTDGANDAPLFAEGIREIIAGRRQTFCLEYPCHSPSQQRWFNGRVTRFAGDGPVRIVVAHENITERKQAEAVLQASETRFQNIVTNVPGMVYQFVLQSDGSVEWPFVSEGCCAVFGVQPEEIRSNPNLPIDCIHVDDRDRFDLSIARSAATLDPWIWEGRFCLPHGVTKWVQAASHPQRLPGGGTLWDGLLMDITTRKEAEEERDRFFTLSLDLLCIIDSRGHFTRLNPAFAATLGFSNGELMAQPFIEFVHPDDVPTTLVEVERLDRGVPTIDFANRYLCRDGSYKWLKWSAAPFNGLLYCVAHDITALKEIEEALLQSRDDLELRVARRTAELSILNGQLQSEIIVRERAEESLYKNHEFLEAVLENVTEGIIACDSEGNPTFFNRATREFHNLPPDTVRPEQLAYARKTNLYLPDGITQMKEKDMPLVRALAGEHLRNSEMVIKPLVGATRTVIANGDPLFTADRKKMGAVVVMHDVTVTKQRELELQQAKEEAEAANHAKSEFLSRMSHELRTPLNAILGFGQILEMQALEPTAKEGVGHILKGGRHLLELINEVLDIASIEAGRLDISLESIAVAAVLGEVLDMMRPLASQHGIRLINEVREQDGLHVLADQQRLKQLMINLLSNAIKYNCTGGRVIISAAQIPGHEQLMLRLCVSDTGKGLTDAELRKLFTPFERLGAARAGIEGTGIGLVLCKRLVEVMNGAIGAKSAVGEGSTFWVEFPLVESPCAALNRCISEPASENPLDSGQPLRTLLYIEDNLSNLRVVEMLLEGMPDVKLLSAMQGGVGLDLAQQHHPDLILLDLHLPDIMGDEVLRRLRALPATRDIPVVILSADAIHGQMERLLAAGANDYLTKPLNLKHFLHVVEGTLLASQVRASKTGTG